MAPIPGGSYALGDRTVTVAPYCLDVTEVTVSSYAACMNAGACSEPGQFVNEQGNGRTFCNWKNPGRALHPINCVDWSQATSFCGWASKRIPSEGEWEWAARNGPDGSTFAWGDQVPDVQRGNFCGKECPPNAASKGFAAWTSMANVGNDGFPETAPVGSFPQGDNRWGVHDLDGNVWEWTSSTVDATAAARVTRGGAWTQNTSTFIVGVAGVHASFRDGQAPSVRNPNLGFRCAR
jgi:formylglycine-generating enzyme required for sulfatase activity